MSPKELTYGEEQRIYAVKTYILNHLNEKFTLQQLARKAALGKERFKDGFYRLFKMHVGAYIHASRMQTGKFLLTHTEKSIKEIAALVGYREYKSYLKAYKKFFAVSAGEQRKRR